MTGVQTCALPICFPVTIHLVEKYVPDPDQRRAFVAEIRALIPGGDEDADGIRGIAPQLPAFAGTTG